MSEFSVQVIKLDDVVPHPNADAIEIAVIGGYQSIVQKGAFKAGDLAVYIPEGSVVPVWLLKSIGLEGKLSGSAKNRVKAIKLRGLLSQGITVALFSQGYPAITVENGSLVPVEEGTEVSDLLGITKWEPSVPPTLAGQVGALHGFTKSYDFENIKKHQTLFDDNQLVTLTEKVHGTLIEIGWCSDLEPRDDLFDDGRLFVTSKGIAGKGLFIRNVPENDTNLYVRALRQTGLITAVREVADEIGADRLYVFGEVFGDVQDLKYGLGQGQIDFRLFDVFVATLSPEYGEFVDSFALPHYAKLLGVESMPVIAKGLWADIKPDLDIYTSGPSTFDPKQIREGVVIKTDLETKHPRYGRRVAKSVSEAYLLRKGLVTEFA